MDCTSQCNDTAQRTLADCLDTFLASRPFSLAQERNLRAMVRKFAELAGVAPGRLMLSAPELQRLFEEILPARFGVMPKRWSNICSAIRAIARHAGVIAEGRARKRIRSDEWEALWQRLPVHPYRSTLTAFVTYCSRVGIEPGMVGDDTLESFAEWRAAHTSRTLKPRYRSRIVFIWNRATNAIAGWPAQRLATPPRRATIEEQLKVFPEAFRQELEAYLKDRLEGPGDPFAVNYGRRLASPTVYHRRYLILRTAKAMIKGGVAPGDLQGLSDLVQPDRVKRALQHLYQDAGNQWPPSVSTLCSHLRAIAQDLGETGHVLEELQEFAQKAQPVRRLGLSKKVHERLRLMERTDTKAKLFRLAEKLVEEAAEHLAGGRRHRAASLHEAAVLFSMLLLMPMRVRNFCSLDLDRHFTRDRRGRAVTLHIPADETKNDRPIDWEMPEEFVRLLHAHATVYRPLLATASKSRWLFPGAKGRHRVPEALSRLLGKLGEERLGVRSTAHMFRHLVATLLFEDNPRNVAVAQHVLGHTNQKTTERMYGEQRMRGALAEHGKALERERARLAAMLPRHPKAKR